MTDRKKLEPKKVRGLRLRYLCLLAFAAMFAQDVLGTLMVVFEAHLSARPAAAMDQLQWMVAEVSGGIATVSLVKDGWTSRRTLAIFAAISAGNILGTFTGVHLAGIFA